MGNVFMDFCFENELFILFKAHLYCKTNIVFTRRNRLPTCIQSNAA